MRKLVTVLGAAALLSFVPVAAQAQVLIGPTLAFHDDFDFGIGATVGFDLPSIAEGAGFMGDFIYFFPDGFDYFEFNLNGTYDFPIEDSTVMPFVLAGLNIGRVSVDIGGLGSASNTDVALNLGGGVAFDAGSFRPKVGGRFAFGDGTGFVVFATLPFDVSGGN
jgi:hypothetical protein